MIRIALLKPSSAILTAGIEVCSSGCIRLCRDTGHVIALLQEVEVVEDMEVGAVEAVEVVGMEVAAAEGIDIPNVILTAGMVEEAVGMAGAETGVEGIGTVAQVAVLTAGLVAAATAVGHMTAPAGGIATRF